MLARLLALGTVAAAFPASAQQPPPTGGAPVEFATTKLGGGTEGLRGILWRPSGTSRGAVVLVHGSSGWTDVREGHYGRALSAAGYTVLALDAFGPRGVGSTAEDQTRLGSLQMTQDAFAARKYLVDAGADPSRTAIMGFSKGGQVSLFAADRTWLPAQAERFQLAIPFYPGCNARPKEPRPASTVFMALGEKDDYTGIKPCQEIASDFQRAGGRVHVKIYPNSTHGFDGDPRNISSYRLPTVENYINCVAEVEPDGTLVYQGKRYAQGDSGITQDFKATCMKRGATLWTNLSQKQQATQDVITFLNDAFPEK